MQGVRARVILWGSYTGGAMGFDVMGDDAWRGEIHVSDENMWRGDLHPEAPRHLPPKEPNAFDFVTVYRASDPSIAEMIRGLLDDATIPYMRMADAATGVFGVPRHLEIVVPVDRAEDALALIRDYVDADVEVHGLHGGVTLIPGRWLMRVFCLLFLLSLGLLGIAEIFGSDSLPQSATDFPESHRR